MSLLLSFNRGPVSFLRRLRSPSGTCFTLLYQCRLHRLGLGLPLFLPPSPSPSVLSVRTLISIMFPGLGPRFNSRVELKHTRHSVGGLQADHIIQSLCAEMAELGNNRG